MAKGLDGTHLAVNAWRTRITARFDGSLDVFDATVDSLSAPPDDPAVRAALENARLKVSAPGYDVLSPALVSSSVAAVESEPVSNVANTTTLVTPISVSSSAASRILCVGDLGDLAQPPPPLPEVPGCAPGAWKVELRAADNSAVPPVADRLDDTHAHAQTDTYSTLLVTGNFTTSHYEIVAARPSQPCTAAQRLRDGSFYGWDYACTSTSHHTVQHDSTLSLGTNAWSTRITGRLSGGPPIFDVTLNATIAPDSDGDVLSAFEDARHAVAQAAHPAVPITGPLLLSSSARPVTDVYLPGGVHDVQLTSFLEAYAQLFSNTYVCVGDFGDLVQPPAFFPGPPCPFLSVSLTLRSYGTNILPGDHAVSTHVHTQRDVYAGLYVTGTLTTSHWEFVAEGATCVDVNYAILDLTSGIWIPLSSGITGQYFGVATGQNLRFQASGTGINTAEWTFGDGGTGSGNPKFYTYTTAGTFTATVTVNSNASCSKSYSFHVTGPSGLFTARYADNSVFSSTHVDSGKALSFLAMDTADSYAWNFGDGFTATGKNPTHAFVVNGSTNVTYTTTLTVTIGSQNWSTSQTFTVIPPPEPPKWVVPGMAYVNGQIPGTIWQSDVTIFNPDPSRTATYSITFLDARNPVDDHSELTWTQVDVTPLGSVAFGNILSSVFGQTLGAYGALMVRGDVAPLPPVITARTFNNGDPTKGTFGLSVPPMSVTGGVSSQASPAASVLIGLKENADAYTNLGLVNLNNDWPKIQLDFLDGLAAAPLASRVVDMKPYQSLQINHALLDAGYASTSDLYTVKVTILQGTAVYPYATVIDVNSTDPIVVTPTEAPSNAYRLPGIVRLTGANGEHWRSRVTVSNPSGTIRKVHMVFSYVPCDTSGCASQVSIAGDIVMTPGQTQSWDDFVSVWLSVKGPIPVDDETSYQNSFLDISPTPGDANSDPLVVLGETYNDTPNGHVGFQIQGYTPQDGASRTGANKRLALTGLASTTAYRTNLALFVVAGTTGKWVNIHVYSLEGMKLRDVPVYVDGFSQVNNGTLFDGLPGDLSRLSIVIDNIDDGVTMGGYATIIDNKSGDATFVKAQPAP
jgi:PKD domain